MSKIYEALLRAEQERTDKNGSSTNGVRSAEEMALANTLNTYVPEAQPHFGEGPDITGSMYSLPVVAEPTPMASFPIGLPASPFSAPPVPPRVMPVAPRVMPVAPASTFAAPPYEAAAATSASATIPAPQPFAEDGFSSIRAVKWHPVVERLPALSERGQSVEQFRSLRSRLAEFRDSSLPLKSIVVTSGLPQEGKSFIAANLALSLSRHRANRVLLIDGDIRRSSLHAMLGTSAEPGLTEYLSGGAELFDVLQRCDVDEPEAAFHNGLASLTFIPGGGEPEKAADLSGSPRFAEMLGLLGPMFDWIIIDSSPVNLVSDGVNLARASDGVLLVAREAVTKFETAQHAQQQLKSTHILGVVLNAVHAAGSKTDEYNYGPYGTYGSYGGYGYSTSKR